MQVSLRRETAAGGWEMPPFPAAHGYHVPLVFKSKYSFLWRRRKSWGNSDSSGTVHFDSREPRTILGTEQCCQLNSFMTHRRRKKHHERRRSKVVEKACIESESTSQFVFVDAFFTLAFIPLRPETAACTKRKVALWCVSQRASIMGGYETIALMGYRGYTSDM